MTIDAVFRKYIYTDDRTGYTVIRVKQLEGGYVIATSNRCLCPPNLTEGCVVRLTGELGKSREAYFPYYAEPGFAFTSIEMILPPDIAHTADYIAGMGIKGLGPSFAAKVAEITGPDLKAYFEKYPDPEALVKRVHCGFFRLETAKDLIRKIYSYEVIKELFDFLKPCNLTFQQVFRLYSVIAEARKDMSIDEFKEAMFPSVRDDVRAPTIYDYCRLAHIPFLEADQVGKMLGYTAYNATRRRYLARYLMDGMSARGNTWSPLQAIYDSAKYVEALSAFPDVIISKRALYATFRADQENYVVDRDRDMIFLSGKWKSEHAIAYHIKRLKTSHRPLPFSNTYITDIENIRNVKFSATQRKCFDFLKTTGVKIVTGNAGTGKTTVISNLLHVYTEMCPNNQVALCAPTGRAAQRMTELCENYGTSVKASTIHKLLAFKPCTNTLTVDYNEDNPLPADFIIVDEMSMVDTDLFAMLLAAIKPGALVILCGDVDQLPSVAAGKVFSDLIESNTIDCVRLDTNYRQGSGNRLIANADKINKGDHDLLCGNDFEIITCDDEAKIQSKVIAIARQEPECAILSPVHKGFIGVDTMNRVLQPILNPSNEQGISFNGITVKRNDRILMQKNNYDIGYVNGDIGIVTAIVNEGIYAKFGLETKMLPKETFTDISLAYCMTIHKFQGSECDTAIIILPMRAPKMLVRNLLYTAVSRAKKKVYLIEQTGGIQMAIDNVKISERRTFLKELLV